MKPSPCAGVMKSLFLMGGPLNTSILKTYRFGGCVLILSIEPPQGGQPRKQLGQVGRNRALKTLKVSKNLFGYHLCAKCWKQLINSQSAPHEHFLEGSCFPARTGQGQLGSITGNGYRSESAAQFAGRRALTELLAGLAKEERRRS